MSQTWICKHTSTLASKGSVLLPGGGDSAGLHCFHENAMNKESRKKLYSFYSGRENSTVPRFTYFFVPHLQLKVAFLSLSLFHTPTHTRKKRRRGIMQKREINSFGPLFFSLSPFERRHHRHSLQQRATRETEILGEILGFLLMGKEKTPPGYENGREKQIYKYID